MAVTTRFPTAHEVYAAYAQLTLPGNMLADDAADATANVTAAGSAANRFTTFGFDAQIPVGSYIRRVRLIFEWGCPDNGIVLYANLAVDGVDQSQQSQTSPQTYPNVVTFDCTGNRAWTRDDLLDAAFKAVVIISDESGGSGGTANLDYMKVEVEHDLLSKAPAGWLDPELRPQNWF